MVNVDKQNRKARTLKGEVVSDKMTKTIVVSITRLRKHPKYKKYYKKTKRYKVHDENQEYHIGDKVVIHETKPLSKDKKWIVVKKK